MFTIIPTSIIMKTKPTLHTAFFFTAFILMSYFASAQTTLQIPIASWEDDAEEYRSEIGGEVIGTVDLYSSDLELTFDQEPLYVGLLFRDVQIPAGANITNAYVQFQVDAIVEGTTDADLTLQVYGAKEATVDAITEDPFSISAHPHTDNTVIWYPKISEAVGDRGENELTPDISGIIAEIVALEGWVAGNNILIVVAGDGSQTENINREMESFDGDAAGAPALIVTYGEETAIEKIIEPNIAFLNDMIMGDTAVDGSRVETIYILRRDSEYFIEGAFENHDWKLHIKAEDGTGALPHVTPFPDEYGEISSYMFNLYEDAHFENIFFDGQSMLDEMYGTRRLMRNRVDDFNLTADGCIFANFSQTVIRIYGFADMIKFNNCRFFNLGMDYNDYFGTGIAIDCRDSDINLLSVTNCTFANNIDRIIRHFGFPEGGTLHNVVLDHCTILNNAAFYGFLELGVTGASVQITNNLMYDCVGSGNDPSDLLRLDQSAAHGETDLYGNPVFVWVGSVPNETTSWKIDHNIYTVSTELQAFYTANNISEGPDHILTEHIKGKLNDASAAFVKKDFSLFETPPTLVDFYNWYWNPLGANKQPFPIIDVEYDRKDTDFWLNTFDATLITDDQGFMGSDGILVGDPRWGTFYNAPSFTSTAVTNATVEVEYQYQATIQDGYGTGTFSLSSSPAATWLGINGASGLISGTAAIADAGSYAITVTYNDGYNAITQVYPLVVADPYVAPVFTSTAVTDATVEIAYQYQAVIQDGAGSGIFYLGSMPEATWLSIDGSTGLVSGTAAITDAGSYAIIVTYYDGRSIINQDYNLTVADPYVEPAFTSTAVTDATVEVEYQYQAAIQDGAGSGTFSLNSSPVAAWLSIDGSTGLVSGTAAIADAGSYAITVTYDDGRSTITQVYPLVVADPYVEPTFTSTAVTEATVETEYQYQVTIQDGAGSGTFSLTSSPVASWLSIDQASGLVSGTAAAGDAGSYAVTVAYGDGRSTIIQVYLLEVIVDATSVLEQKENSLQVYPNPANDVIYINTGNSYNELTNCILKIINTSGSVVLETNITEQIIEIEVSDLGQRGLYLIQIVDGSNQITDTGKIILKGL